MPKYVSAEQHELKGTEPRPRLAPVVSTTIHGGRPKCPRHLSKAARKEWLSAVKLLESRGTLDPGAGPTLEVYAETRARWLEAKADIAARGLQIEVQKATSKGELYTVTAENPMLKIAESCESALQQLTKQLGIAPDAREKVKKVKQPARPGALPAWYTAQVAGEKES